MANAKYPLDPSAEDAPDDRSAKDAPEGVYNPGPIPASKVRYLSFKGGGGKGWAFLGALAAFTHSDIRIMTKGSQGDWTINTPKIGGIAGTSAGGLIGALVALGMSLDSLFGMVLDERDQLLKFFDPPYGPEGSESSYVPIATKGEYVLRRPKASPDGTTDEEKDEKIRGAARYKVNSNRNDLESSTPVQLSSRWYLPIDEEYECLKGILGALLTKDDDPPQTFEDNLEGHFHNLARDGGVCSGVWAREYIARKLNSEGRSSMTFGEMPTRSYPKLCLVGSDVTPGNERMVYFSPDSTPKIKIADAMRITMGFPGLFKPVVIGPKPFVWSEQSKFYYKSKEANPNKQLPESEIPSRNASFDARGIWIDGGVTNQLAAHAFDDNGARDDSGVPIVPVNAYERYQKTSRMNPRMLPINLHDPNPNQVTHGFQAAGASITGLTEVAATEREFRTRPEKVRRLDIPYGPLSLFNFTPTKSELAAATLEAAEATFDYFRVQKDAASHLAEVTPFTEGDF